MVSMNRLSTEKRAQIIGALVEALKDPYPRTPAMAAGVADHVWTLEEVAALLD